ncbi:MAG: hypothetical protein LBE17_09395 [Treponema sp.]|jgi:hypothetical protein|nr:hypothetical protein [Treponema sp.]
MKAETRSRRIFQVSGFVPLHGITALTAGILLLFLPSAAVFSQTQQVIPLSSPLYDKMDALFALCGLAAPSAARPWTNAEAAGMLQRLGHASFGGIAAADSRVQDLYDRIDAEISAPFTFTLDNLAALNLHLDAALEACAHTNSRDFVREEDWRYGYEERKPLLSLALELRAASWFYVTCDLRYGRNRFNERDLRRDTADLISGIGAVIPPPDAGGESYAFPARSWAYSSPFITNVTAGFDEFDFDWPKRANLTVGGNRWNLSIARERIKWGPGRTGNFVFDDHRDYDEYLQFSAFTDNFKYQWLNVFYALPGSGGTGGFKFLMAHRLEFRLLPALVFAVSENIMVHPAGFSPANANPAFIYHNWYDRSHFNAIAQLELDYAPASGWRFYTEAVIDQVRAFWEDAGEPASWGILGGLEHTRFAGPGLLTLSLEVACTSPLLYRRDQVDFLTALPVRVNGSQDNLVFDYTGCPYGGDALVLLLDSRYRFSGGAVVSAGFSGMIHGRMNPFVSHNRDGDNGALANIEGFTPSGSSGEHELSCGVSLRASYTLAKKIGVFTISAWAGADFMVKKNKLMISETGQGEDSMYRIHTAVTDLQVICGIGARL